MISSSALAQFEINTSYFFTKIYAKCDSGLCDVYANDKYKGSYPYHMEGNVAISNINGLSIYYNTLTKELKY